VLGEVVEEECTIWVNLKEAAEEVVACWSTALR
jgi:hypothetical protein